MGIAALVLLASLTSAAPVDRGKRALVDAMRVALRGRPGPVLIVVDATPYTKAAATTIGNALHDLARTPGPWRLARLGDKPLIAQPVAAALTIQLTQVLAEPQRHVSTLRALRQTLAGFPDRRGRVLYLADWHFEDDEGLERVVAALKQRGQTLSVIGSEAAFGRGWTDGFGMFGREEHKDRIGRNAFRTEKGIPWHGGETAYNHIPYLFGGAGWKTEFPRSLRTRGSENLGERLGVTIESSGPYRYPLPSAFGPYALMRIAHETGGRYVLWSWNPSGRASVIYDYARCDRFAPDLRSRAAIGKDMRRRRLARALDEAWRVAAEVDLVEMTAPSQGAVAPTRRENKLSFTWPRRDMHQAFLRQAERMIGAADRGLRTLGRAILAAGEPSDPVDRRYLADAHLLHHILLVQRFSLGEAVALARTVGKDAWKDEDTVPGLRDETWIPETPPDAEPTTRHDRHRDKERGAQVLADRTRLLERYRGTPFGEQVRRNEVYTYRLARAAALKPSKGRKPGETPSFSDRDKPEPTPPPTTPGGSGGGGPTTGR